MNRIDERFARLKQQKQAGFIVYIAAGDPDLAALLSSRSGMPRGQESYLTYDISPLPKDQFSFGTSTRLTRMSSRRKPGEAASLSAIVR